ncbi:hypothetical protein F5B20DRAFT_518113 [Whalleya microplaca]|nr:hypothetical protein F5B20DRAFT_518113 [Whalleya microplaca]
MTPAPTPANAFTVSLKAESGCEVTASATKSERNNWDFTANSVHMTSSTCRCPRAHEKSQMLKNEEKLWRHSFALWQTGKSDIPGMLDIFARQTLGMFIEKGLALERDDEKKTWGDSAKKEGVSHDNSSSFVGVAKSDYID